MTFRQLFQKKQADDLLSSSTVPGGGRRLSGMPLVLIACLGVSLAAVLGYVAYSRTEQRDPGVAEVQEKSSPAINFAKELTEQSHGQLFMPPAIPKEEEKPAEPEIKKEPAGQLKVQRGPEIIRLSPDEERVRGEKMRSLEAALKSRTSIPVQFSQNQTAGAGAMSFDQASMRTSDPVSAYQARLAQVNATLPAQESSGGMMTLSGSASGQEKRVEQFNRQNRWTLENRLETPASPYIVRAGFVMPAIMLSSITSDLPGQVMAQISQNIYDSATGRYLLIPQGTRLVGTYASDIAYGQNRVMMAWQRLIFPDGKTLDIGAMPGADQAGNAGFKDKVDNHYFRIFGSAILLSGVIAGVTLSQDDNGSSRDSDRQRASDALSEALGQTLGNAMAQMLQKNLNIAPTLEIRPGYRFNVMVTKDLVLPGVYRAFDY